MKKMKYLLGVLAIALALCLPMVAAAADSSAGSTSDDGDVEGVLSNSVFSVTLPTLANPDTTYKFHIDPNQMIKATGGTRYGSASVEDAGTLIFTQNDTGTKKYTGRSNALSVINKSNFGVTATVEARITSSDGISYVEDMTKVPNAATGAIPSEISMYAEEYSRTATGAKSYSYTPIANTKAYLHAATAGEIAEDATRSSANAIAVLSMDLSALAKRDSDGKRNEDAYEYKWSSTDKKYSYELKSDFGKYYNFDTNRNDLYKNVVYFALAGEANPYSTDWEAVKTVKPAISVKWTIQPTEYAIASEAKYGTTQATIEDRASDGSYTVTDGAASNTVTYGKFTITDGAATPADVEEAIAGQRFKVTFTPEASTYFAVKKMTLGATAPDIARDSNQIASMDSLKDQKAERSNTGWFDMPDSEAALLLEISQAYTLTFTGTGTKGGSDFGSYKVLDANGAELATGATLYVGDTFTVVPEAKDGYTVAFAVATGDGSSTGSMTGDNGVYTVAADQMPVTAITVTYTATATP